MEISQYTYIRMRILCFSLIALFVAGSALAQPLDANASAQAGSFSATTAPIQFFQRFLSGADGNRCPMTPSCSNYAIEAIQRYGAVKGWIMACDRLLRCGHDELRLSPAIMTRHGIRYLDPVTNNDLWLR